ncbi:methyl viologen resistance protein SmvA [Salmonella enterica subsp. enterica]|uniref:Methyl viologen resistance protein SmvA n=1 Tax=Salmonella enterica I TaxID=59201 RepID=A0A447MSP9_SALET|nr:methyl viologen resistance protein SmvA [Salmonella enterica subsp. enterica]
MPIVLVVMGLTARYVPRQAGRRDQPLNLGHAVMLIIAILLLVYSAKTALKGHLSLWVISLTLLTGALLLGLFIRTQLATSRPMIDMRLFTHPHYPERRRDGDDRDDHLWWVLSC